MVPTYRSPVKLEVARDGTPSTARGGLVVLLELLAAKCFLADLPQADGSPAQGWSDGQMILAVLVLNIAGLDRVSDIDILEADAGLCAMVRRFEPALLGMSRRAVGARFRGGRERCFPSARSIRDWLDRFHVAGVHDVEREKGTAWVAPRTERHDVFREVSRRLVAEGVRGAGAASVTIDLDATIIASGKRECLYTYRAAEGLVPGERGYQPLVAFCPEIGMVPWLEIRDGNVPAKLDNLRGLDEALLQLPGEVRQVTLRTDGAGYQENVIRACNNPAFRREETRRFGTIGLVCGAKRSEHLMAEVARLGEDAWRPVTGPADTGSGHTVTDRAQLECAELPFVSNASCSARPHHVIRYVVTRRAIPGGLGLDEGELPAAGGRPAYAIRAYMTNFPAPDSPRMEKTNGLKTMDAGEVVAAAHDRCGREDALGAVRGERRLAVALGAGAERHGAGAPHRLRARVALGTDEAHSRGVGPSLRPRRPSRSPGYGRARWRRHASHGGAQADEPRHAATGRTRVRLIPAPKITTAKRTRHGAGGRCSPARCRRRCKFAQISPICCRRTP